MEKVQDDVWLVVDGRKWKEACRSRHSAFKISWPNAFKISDMQSSCGLQVCMLADTGGAEDFLVELLLDFRDKELWDLDLGLSAAMAAMTSMATGQNHSCSLG